MFIFVQFYTKYVYNIFCFFTIIYLPQILWENILQGDVGNDCLVSLDGTDFQIREPHPWCEQNKIYYSHKLKEPGLRYEVSISIITGDIVWLNGPYECGKWNDLDIFRDGLVHYLIKNERVEDDKGYVGEDPRHTKTPKGFTRIEKHLKFQGKVRARHETFNKRFKKWGILKNIFRHSLEKHSIVFIEVVVITQVSINNGDLLFKIYKYKNM